MKRLFLFFLLLSLSTMAFAQSAQFLDGVVSSPRISAEDGAYLLLVASGAGGEDSSPSQALALTQEKGWVPRSLSVGASPNLEEYCQLLCQAFKVQGNLMYRMTHAPRYAFRSLRSSGLLPEGTDPAMAVDGNQALSMLSRLDDIVQAQAKGSKK
jgi:hypothetical protein